MKSLSFVLVLVLSFGIVTACFAMGKLNTQGAETTPKIVPEAEKAVAAEAYSAPVDVEEVEDSMAMDMEPVEDSMAMVVESVEDPIVMAMETAEEVVAEQEVVVESGIVTVPEVVEDSGVLEELGIIDQFNAMATTREKISFLLGKADGFYNSGQFQKAIDAAQYILQYLDADSQQAKEYLTMAKDKLTAFDGFRKNR